MPSQPVQLYHGDAAFKQTKTIIMFIYHALINALSTHTIHIKYDILYTHRAQFYQNNLHKV